MLVLWLRERRSPGRCDGCPTIPLRLRVNGPRMSTSTGSGASDWKRNSTIPGETCHAFRSYQSEPTPALEHRSDRDCGRGCGEPFSPVSRVSSSGRCHPSIPHRCSRAGPRRPSSPPCSHTVARQGDSRGSISGRAAGDSARARALLADGLRLAEGRSATQFTAAVHHRDRRTGHPFHSCSLETRECLAADRHAWMAWLGHRAAEDYRPLDQSHGTWRRRIGRFPSRDPVDAGLRLFGQADRDRLGSLRGSRAPGSC